MASVRLTVATMPPGRRILAVAGGAIAVLLLLVVGSAAVLRASGRNTTTGRAASAGTATNKPAATAGAVPVPGDSGTDSALASDLNSLRVAPAVQPAVSHNYPAIPTTDRAQAHVYARAFVTELFTQDYRTNRSDLLRWVQSETVPTIEPLVIGLVPSDLQPKLGVWSVSSTSDGSPTPIPAADEWQAWTAKQASTTVQILRVSEPTSWSEAVSAGRIADPGVTARDVDAVVTTRWVDHGQTRTSKRSVFLSLTLEGPPARSGFGYVNCVAYRTAPIGG
jgi:hypothetical protein